MSFLASIIYNVISPFLCLGMLPFGIRKSLRRGGYDGKFGNRFAKYSQSTIDACNTTKDVVLIQAVSVGEAMVASKLVREIHHQHPDKKMVLAVTTPTGYQVAKNEVDQLAEIIFTPIDLLGVIGRFFKLIKPDQIILVDSDIWPNQIAKANKLGIPITVVNARLSKKSEARFQKFNFLTKPIFQKLSRVCVDNEEDIGRWNRLGVSIEKIHHTGSIKYDEELKVKPTQDYQETLNSIWGEDFLLLLGVSTHKGEEIMLARTWKSLVQQYLNVRLAIVPRHAERGHEVSEELEEEKLNPILVTEYRKAENTSSIKEQSVLLLNTTGELLQWQTLADIVVIGKSFTANGGQNPAEAASLGVPVITGPNMTNFEGIMKILQKNKGVIQVENELELKEQLQDLINDSRLREVIGSNGKNALALHKGATAKTVELIFA